MAVKMGKEIKKLRSVASLTGCFARYVNYRTTAADTAHHHHRADGHPSPTEQVGRTGTIPHDGSARAKTIYDASVDARRKRTLHGQRSAAGTTACLSTTCTSKI